MTHTAQLTYRYLERFFKGIKPPELPQKEKRSMSGETADQDTKKRTEITYEYH